MMTDYFLATIDSTLSTNSIVIMLADGWLPYGNPFTCNGVVHQAMVKYQIFHKEKTGTN